MKTDESVTEQMNSGAEKCRNVISKIADKLKCCLMFNAQHN